MKYFLHGNFGFAICNFNFLTKPFSESSILAKNLTLAWCDPIVTVTERSGFVPVTVTVFHRWSSTDCGWYEWSVVRTVDGQWWTLTVTVMVVDDRWYGRSIFHFRSILIFHFYIFIPIKLFFTPFLKIEKTFFFIKTLSLKIDQFIIFKKNFSLFSKII